MLVFQRHFFLLFTHNCEKFSEMQCVSALILFHAYLLRKRVCIHSRNVIDKCCIVITSVEQSLQLVDYAW